MNKVERLHTIAPGASLQLSIPAEEIYSPGKISVTAGEEYLITCNADQRWTDWFITCSPRGFFNLPAWLTGLRVKGAKCFCLCGAYNNTDEGAFAIGTGKKITAVKTGTLSFFANDAKGHYENNKGSVMVLVERV